MFVRGLHYVSRCRRVMVLVREYVVYCPVVSEGSLWWFCVESGGIVS